MTWLLALAALLWLLGAVAALSMSSGGPSMVEAWASSLTDEELERFARYAHQLDEDECEAVWAEVKAREVERAIGGAVDPLLTRGVGLTPPPGVPPERKSSTLARAPVQKNGRG